MDAVDDRVADAMRRAAREDFLPPDQRSSAGADRPLPLSHGQTNSQPSTVAEMLRLLDVPEGASVLDLGAGSGWTTVLLAHLVGPSGSVLGLELVPELVDFGGANVAAAGVPWARVEAAEAGALGRPAQAPFDRILVSAMARELPDDLVAQLADPGVLVIPVAGRMLRVTRGGGVEVRRLGYYRFVPLR